MLNRGSGRPPTESEYQSTEWLKRWAKMAPQLAVAAEKASEIQTANIRRIIFDRTLNVVARREFRAPTKGGLHEASQRLQEEAVRAVAHPPLVVLWLFGGHSERASTIDSSASTLPGF